MSSPKPLKAQNLPLLVSFFVLCTIGFVGFCAQPLGSWPVLESGDESMWLTKGAFLGIAPLFVLLVTGLVPPTFKHRLIFLRWNQTMPSFRAFSEHARKDVRIDIVSLERDGDLPECPNEQNRMWFKYYKQHESKPSVIKAHKQFLLFREIGIIATVFAVFGSISLAIIHSSLQWILLYVAVYGAAAVVSMLVARVNSYRIVKNVLVEQSVNPYK